MSTKRIRHFAAVMLTAIILTCAKADGAAPPASARVVYNPANGRYYEFVQAEEISWSNAKSAAERRVINCNGLRLRGYLATVTTLEEQKFLERHFLQCRLVWLGGTDAGAGEGSWRWVTGPERLLDGGKGLRFWQGGPNGAAPSGRYHNWIPRVEPNNSYEEPGEDFLSWNHNNGSTKPGQWNDLQDGSDYDLVSGYLVEYGTDCGRRYRLFERFRRR